MIWLQAMIDGVRDGNKNRVVKVVKKIVVASTVISSEVIKTINVSK